MFLINSRLGLFTAAHFHEHPFSRSYGVILPSSLTRVRSLTLEFSSQLPVSVCGTGSITLASGFSWQCEYRSSGVFPPHHDLPYTHTGFAWYDSLSLARTLPVVRFDSPPASPLHSFMLHRYRNFYLLSIAYAVCLGLGPDLPRADEPSSGNLSLSVDGILTRLALLTPAFSLLYAPLSLSVWLRCI